MNQQNQTFEQNMLRLEQIVRAMERGDVALEESLKLFQEGTEQGLMTLLNWMDDCIEKLLGQKFIPHTDLFLNEASMVYSLYTDQSFIVDKRPIYYGFVNAEFSCYANEGANPSIEQYLQ